MEQIRRKLLLDDERTLQKAGALIPQGRWKELYDDNLNWVVVKSYDEFVEFINTMGVPDFVSFDHDLADEHYAPVEVHMDMSYNDWASKQDFKEKTGLECAKWLCDYCFANDEEFPLYLVHSQNPVGRKNIESYIENFKKHNRK